MARKSQRSPLALAVLALLYEAPMHPYRMQRLIKERGKDEVINVRQRASLYQTIERLLRVGLIRVRETERDENRPERTIYELTDEGRESALAWMRDVLSTPGNEFPEFPAAISFLPLLEPSDAMKQLGARAAALEAERARVEVLIAPVKETLPRLFLLESEYALAMLAAELEWVRTLVADLKAGRVTWSEEWLRQFASGFQNEEGSNPS